MINISSKGEDDLVRRGDILTALHSGNIDLGYVSIPTYIKLEEFSWMVDQAILAVPAYEERT